MPKGLDIAEVEVEREAVAFGRSAGALGCPSVLTELHVTYVVWDPADHAETMAALTHCKDLRLAKAEWRTGPGEPTRLKAVFYMGKLPGEPCSLHYAKEETYGGFPNNIHVDCFEDPS